MNEIELNNSVNQLLLKIHVITGWNIPANELMYVLVEQFRLKILESYSNLNLDEVEFAFRNNEGVKEWGKNMSINLIDEVLRPYIVKRMELSEIEEMLANKKILPPEKKELTNDEMKEWIDEWILKYPSIINFQIIPLDFYDAIIKNNEVVLSNDNKKEYWNKAIEVKRQEYKENIEKYGKDNLIVKVYNIFEESVKINEFKEGEAHLLRIISKKLVIFDYLKNKYNDLQNMQTA